jgi:hypothetical protein
MCSLPKVLSGFNRNNIRESDSGPFATPCNGGIDALNTRFLKHSVLKLGINF